MMLLKSLNTSLSMPREKFTQTVNICFLALTMSFLQDYFGGYVGILLEYIVVLRGPYGWGYICKNISKCGRSDDI